MNKQPEKSNQSDADPPQSEKKPVMKLTLRRETLRTLSPDDLAQVVGGRETAIAHTT